MIYDHIDNVSRYAGLGRIYDALLFLQTKKQPLIEGMNMAGEEFSANFIKLITKSEDECIFEAHRVYADIHFIVSGIEGIGIGNKDHLQAVGEFDPSNDIGFYSGDSSGIVYLSPGDFMICFAGEAHKVAIALDAPERVEKIVVKVRIH